MIVDGNELIEIISIQLDLYTLFFSIFSYLHNMDITEIPTGAFQNVRLTRSLNLYGNDITKIGSGAFDVNINDNL